MIFDCTERYDPVTKQWAAVASLNFPRCGVGVCPCHGALYALGKCHSSTMFVKHTMSQNLITSRVAVLGQIKCIDKTLGKWIQTGLLQ